MIQQILSGDDKYQKLSDWMAGKRVMIVCGKSFSHLQSVKETIENHKDACYFSDYTPNPEYESVVKGVEEYNRNHCDSIIAVGGGSAIDVAKCIKLFCNMRTTENYLTQEKLPNQIPFLVVPTTAGTGSEATRYAVIYHNGIKQSVTSDFSIPDTVLLDPDNLNSLPLYQRKATMLDTLAHALESMWSINSTDESRAYSKEALSLFKENMSDYLNNQHLGNAGMQRAAYIAGKAINITQTTAGHAMSYKITSLFGCSHGHAAMMCNRKLLPWMIRNIDKCVDKRGEQRLKDSFQIIADTFDCKDISEAAAYIQKGYDKLVLDVPHPNDDQLRILTDTVNVDRLKNNPVRLDQNDIGILYRQILGAE